MDKTKSGIISWLASMSEYKKGLLGPGGGMHSTEGHSVLTVISTTVGNHGVERKGTKVTKHMNICSNMHSSM